MNVQSLGQEDPLEKEMATHSTIVWKTHEQKSLAGYSPRGCKESDIVRQTNTVTIFYYFFTSSMFYTVFIIIYFSDSIIIHYVLCLVLQLCSTLCDPRAAAHQGPLFMGIVQARILKWVAMPSPRESHKARDRTQVSCFAGRFFTVWATRKAQYPLYHIIY